MARTVTSGGGYALAYSSVPENEYPLFDSTRAYTTGEVVIAAGSKYPCVYEAIANSTGAEPKDSPTLWLSRGATNRHMVHDDSVQTQTVFQGELRNQYQLAGACNTLAILGVNASSVRIIMFDFTDGVVYHKDLDLIAKGTMDNIYDYFFEFVDPSPKDLILSDLPPYANALLDVTIRSIDGTVRCGSILIGKYLDVGLTTYGARVGIQDFSIKEQDAFGNYKITERPYRKTADFNVIVDNNKVDTVQNTLAQYRAVPVLYIGSAEFGSTSVFGFFKDFDITLAYPSYSICSIQVEGLT